MMKRITIPMLLALVAVGGVSTGWTDGGSSAAHLDDVEAP